MIRSSLSIALTIAVAGLLVGCGNAGDEVDEGSPTGGTFATGTGGGLNGGSSSAGAGAGEEDFPNTEDGAGGNNGLASVCADAAPSVAVDLSLHGHPSTAAAQYARTSLLSAKHAAPDPALVVSQDFLSYYGLPFTSENPGADPELSLRWYGLGNVDPLAGALELDLATVPHVREPLRLVVLFDVSPSLSQALDIERSALEALAAGFAADAAAGDSLAVLTFAAEVVTVFDGPIDPAQALGGVPVGDFESRAGNDFDGAVRAALATAVTGGPAHVLVVTDGGVNLREDLLETVRGAAASGVRLSVAQVGVPLPTGPAPLDRAFLDTLAGAGRGATFYLGDTGAAHRPFARRFGATFGVFARGVVAHIQLPPGLEAFGLPAPGPDQTMGPSGGLLGSGATYPLRVGLRAACGELFTTEDALGGEFIVSVTSDAGPLVMPRSFDLVGTRKRDALAVRNDAIVAVASAIRTKKADDVAEARELLTIASDPSKCLFCEDLEELGQMLDFVAP